MSTGQPHEKPDAVANPPWSMEAHRQRVVAAEIRRLERHLMTIGPMPRQRLAEACGSDRWREGTFEEALREGIRQGVLRPLPLGWIEAAHGPSARRSHSS